MPRRLSTIDRSSLSIPGGPWSRALAALGSTWTLGLLAAVATWNVAFLLPLPGLDESTAAGLYIAANRGMHFGSQVVTVFGPLGFLTHPWLWYRHLGIIAFLYQAVLHIALCVSLIWALRRTLHPVVTIVVTFFVVITAPYLDVPVVLTAIWCLASLSPTTPRFARWLVLFGGAILAAIETLRYLRDGPVIFLVCALTLFAAKRWRQELPLFLGLAGVIFISLWFASGQTLGNFPTFVTNSLHEVTGNSEAMGLPHPPGVSAVYLVGELLLGAALVTTAALTSAGGPRRAAAVVVLGLIVFSMYKEAAVRSDFGHTAIFYGTAAGLIAAIAFDSPRVLALAALAAISLVNVEIDSNGGLSVNYDPTTYVNQTTNQLRLLFDTDGNLAARFAAGLRQTYHVSPALLTLLRGRTVHIDPSEVAVSWAYHLNWHPLPVIQDYTAYTSALDRADAAALASRDGPQRIVRQNAAIVGVDHRFPTWDPPEKSLAMLCNYVSLQTTPRWQVLGKVSDRCGTPRLIASEHTRYGAVVTLPLASPSTVVYTKVHGAGVGGLEQVRTFLYRARFRYIQVNGAHLYRLVPGTAGDGLLTDAAPGVDYPRGFALSPSARTLELLGAAGPLRIDIYSMPVRLLPGSGGSGRAPGVGAGSPG